jgi:hypothetical protein
MPLVLCCTTGVPEVDPARRRAEANMDIISHIFMRCFKKCENVNFKIFGEIVCAFKMYKIVFSPHPNILDLF